MAHKNARGTAKNLRDSQSKRLGIKKFGGEKVLAGNIICRQRGTKWDAGDNVGLGKDHTIYALKEGVVKFTEEKQLKFNGRRIKKTIINVA